MTTTGGTDLAATSAENVESPLWRGCRLSVIIPTYNRKEQLLTCLRALQTQSILPQEFEVIVIDDGSTDGTEAVVRAEELPYALRYARQDHQGPGVARNLGIQQAAGELVLFIGDDIIADERLLENHLLAHAQFPGESSAVLGYITWPPWMKPNQLMKYIYGESGRQFGYPVIERAPSLNYRFFYTSNISLKRQFLIRAARAGVRFDPAFRYAAYEDNDFGYRLEALGLEIRYWKDAVAYHDHRVDLESFSRREYLAGQSAVVFYCRHPKLDGFPVRSINDWIDTVEALENQPALLGRVKTLEKHLDDFLHSLASSLEELLETNVLPSGAVRPHALQAENLTSALHECLDAIFTLEFTRGEVQQWYAGVSDQTKIEIAKSLIGCFKGIEVFKSVARAVAAEKESRIQALTAQVAENAARAAQRDEELLAIRQSRSWHLVQMLGRIKNLIFPR